MKAALDYGRLGWSVIPIECRGKQPLIRWQVYQYRHPDATEVYQWFQHWPDANIAIVTGVVSGLVVLDLDPRHGADAALQDLVRAHGPITQTVEARTGGGGCHLYFDHPEESCITGLALLQVSTCVVTEVMWWHHPRSTPAASPIDGNAPPIAVT